MKNTQPPDKLTVLDQRINKIENKPKDNWDRFTSLSGILVPAAIALAGHFISQGIKQAEISNEARRSEQSHIIAQANIKVAQAGLINTLMKSLTSANPQERKIAVAAVLIALPEEGAALVRSVAEYDQNKGVQDAAKKSLDDRLLVGVKNLFSEDAVMRRAAAQELVQGWRSDPNIVKLLIDAANQNKTNENGIYNSVVVLGELQPVALLKHREEIAKFLKFAKSKGPKTKTKVVEVEKKLSGE